MTYRWPCLSGNNIPLCVCLLEYATTTTNDLGQAEAESAAAVRQSLSQPVAAWCLRRRRSIIHPRTPEEEPYPLFFIIYGKTSPRKRSLHVNLILLLLWAEHVSSSSSSSLSALFHENETGGVKCCFILLIFTYGRVSGKTTMSLHYRYFM